MRKVLIASIVCVLSGCSLQNVKMYDGEMRSASDQSVLSSLGIYRESKFSLQVFSINGKSVNKTTAASFIVLPGTYNVRLHAMKDLAFNRGMVSWKESDYDAILDAKAGHTYIPAAHIEGDSISVYFEDKCVNFQQQCLPLYIEVNGGGNPGYALYSTGIKCGMELR